MNKIIMAINSMVLSRDKIKNVVSYRNELFFNFIQYVWSIKIGKDEPDKIVSLKTNWIIQPEEYTLKYYPGYSEVGALLNDLREKKGKIEVMMYTSDSYKTKEATESFCDLYKTVRERLFDLDSVLDDIIYFSEKSKE